MKPEEYTEEVSWNEVKETEKALGFIEGFINEPDWRVAADRMARWTERRFLYEKTSRFYRGHPSHINEDYASGNVVYLAVTHDRPAAIADIKGGKWTGDLDKYEGFIKIGTTAVGAQRMAAIQTGCPYEVVVKYWFRGGYGEESALHKIFAADRTIGEWFILGPALRDYINTMTRHAQIHDVARDGDSLLALVPPRHRQAHNGEEAQQ